MGGLNVCWFIKIYDGEGWYVKGGWGMTKRGDGGFNGGGNERMNVMGNF